MSYAQKLRSPLWQKKRLQILERDKWRCVSCDDSKSNLQVHHLFYAKLEPWDYPDEAYQTLCESCHRKRQAIIDDAINSIRVSLGGIPTFRLGATLETLQGAVDCEASNHFTKDEIYGDPLDRGPVIPPEEGKSLFAAMRAACSDEKSGGAK